MPSYRHHEMGDLIVHINVKFPDSLSPELLAPLESILPPRPELPTFPENIHVDEHVELVEASDRKKAGGGHHGDDAMDEDDDGQGGGPQVQCAKYVFPLSPHRFSLLSRSSCLTSAFSSSALTASRSSPSNISTLTTSTSPPSSSIVDSIPPFSSCSALHFSPFPFPFTLAFALPPFFETHRETLSRTVLTRPPSALRRSWFERRLNGDYS